MSNKELRNFINEIVYKTIKETILLKEADLTKVNPDWKGTYAFILAYNDGIAQGLFPRAQRLDIEFDENAGKLDDTQGKFKNGTLYINPNSYPKSVGFFNGNAGHDMLHGLTQNIQQHFSAIKNRKEDSLNNANEIKFNDIKRFVDLLKQNYNIDVNQYFPGFLLHFGKTKNNDDKSRLLTKLRYYIQDKLTEKDFKNEKEKVLEILNNIQFKRNYFAQKFPQNISNIKTSRETLYNPTHSIEEYVGNIISDTFAWILYDGDFITEENILNMISNLTIAFEEKNYGTEFPPIENDQNERLLEKWVNYLKELIPKFAELYNKRLAMLNKTMFGKNKT